MAKQLDNNARLQMRPVTRARNLPVLVSKPAGTLSPTLSLGRAAEIQACYSVPGGTGLAPWGAGGTEELPRLTCKTPNP